MFCRRLFQRVLHPSLRYLLRYLLVGAVLLMPAWAQAFEPFVVKDVRVQGLQRVDAGTVFGYLPFKVGQKFTQRDADESVRRLYASNLFNDVNVGTEGNVVIVTVAERPTVASITFSGMHEFESKTIVAELAKVGFAEGRIFDQSALDQAETELKQQYLGKGLYSTEVNATVTPLPRNRVGIAFDIFEGARAKIRGIHFVGNKAFSTSTLMDQVDMSTPGWFTWYTDTDKYSRERLEADVDRVRSFYLNHGYLEYSNEPPQVTISPDRTSIYITISIHEGKPYKVRSVKLAGNMLGLDAELKKLVTVKPGTVFDASQTNKTAKAITDYLGELGYAFANVNPSPQLDRAKHEADLTFYIDPSRRVYVRRIQMAGNTRTRDTVIRREMLQQEAAWYDSNQIRQSRDRIDRLGYFTSVGVKTEPVPGSPDQVDVNVNVKEKPTGMVNLGVGYGSADRAIFQAGISQDNLFGSGHNVSFNVGTSSVQSSAVLSETDPYFTKDGISRTVSVYYRLTRPWLADSGQYMVRTLGAGLNFGVPITDTDRIFMGATVERNTIGLYGNNSPLSYTNYVNTYGTTTNALILNTGWSKDTRDSALSPTRGAYTKLSADVGTVGLKYGMLSAQQQYYIPLSRSYTLAFNGLANYGFAYGGKPFPVIKDIYGGGLGSVRGYSSSSLGPRDQNTGDYLGGQRMLAASVQLYLPVPGTGHEGTLRWFLFADAGQVAPTSSIPGSTGCSSGTYSNSYGFTISDPCAWRFSAGVGLSWQSPIGPLQISMGKALNSKPGDNKEAFQFQIGTAF
ncbi:outer membrane protein assembly factor BamA [Bordetella sp. FB-8]|uniref:outer membrane protein assembly factor BamA n=1 Tax=Bordetella sp. FB-8 TaxID=1159870 RepID=UPI0003A9B31B|nr:outer membrane protein assembly factor BamA [Bordetella sp. FB-8]